MFIIFQFVKFILVYYTIHNNLSFSLVRQFIITPVLQMNKYKVNNDYATEIYITGKWQIKIK